MNYDPDVVVQCTARLSPAVKAVGVQMSNGRISLSRFAGEEVALDTSNGAVTIDASSATRPFDVSSSNGAIRVSNTEVAGDFATSNETIDFASVRVVGRTRLRTSNGAVRVRSLNPFRGTGITTRGSVTNSTTGGADAPELSAKTSNGNIVLEHR